MTLPQVRIQNGDGRPTSSVVSIDGQQLKSVLSARWEHLGAGHRPTVEMAIDSTGLDVLGDLTGVEVIHSGSGADARVAMSILAKLKNDGCVDLRPYGPHRPEMAGIKCLTFDETAWADLTDEEAALWERIEP